MMSQIGRGSEASSSWEEKQKCRRCVDVFVSMSTEKQENSESATFTNRYGSAPLR